MKSIRLIIDSKGLSDQKWKNIAHLGSPKKERLSSAGGKFFELLPPSPSTTTMSNSNEKPLIDFGWSEAQVSQQPPIPRPISSTSSSRTNPVTTAGTGPSSSTVLPTSLGWTTSLAPVPTRTTSQIRQEQDGEGEKFVDVASAASSSNSGLTSEFLLPRAASVIPTQSFPITD